MVTSSQVSPLTIGTVHADFRKKYGIPPKGKGPHAPSDYGFPLPPAGHPQALKFAHAVLSRAHQATNFDPKDVARQVTKAKKIVAAHDARQRQNAKSAGKYESAGTPWRQVKWVDVTHPNAKGGFVAINPRKTESAKAFLARYPNAMPLVRAAQLSETERRMYAARRKRIRESATLVRETNLRERTSAQSAFGQFVESKTSEGVVFKNVLLIRAGPGNLGDRHFYTKECLQASLSVFEGSPGYLNHPTPIEEQQRPERDVEKLACYYSNVECRPFTDPELGPTVGMFADLHPRVGDERVLSLIRTCIEYAKLYPRKAFAGLSIYASGDGEPATINGETWNRVDRITAVESVDIVTKAGAGGAIVPLKESNRMSKTKTDQVALVLDADKVKSGVSSLFEARGTALKAKLAESGVAADKIDAIVNEYAEASSIDKILDEATDVQEDDGIVEATPAATPADDEDDDVTEGMTPEQLAAFNKMKKAAKEATTRAVTAETKLTESNGKLSLVERKSMAADMVESEEIPNTFRPRLVQELVTAGYTTPKQMREHTQAFDKAFIRKESDGAGAYGGSSTSKTAAGNFNFDEEV